MKKGSTKGKGKGNGTKGLRRINPQAAGIDVGSREHYVAVPPVEERQSVRVFGCYTDDLHEIARWLVACSVSTVALESTGVFWIPVCQVLERYDLKVVLVNAREARNVPGRKTDVLDCQWLQELHTYGLLKPSFRPSKEICVLRSLWRHRDNLVSQCARQIHLMQKTLEQMNIQLHKVLTDIAGTTGMAILRAIAGGERNPHELARLRHPYVKRSEDEIAAALTGDWRQEHIFVLVQSLEAFDFYQRQVEKTDLEILEYMRDLESHDGQTEPACSPSPRKSRRKNQPHFDLRAELIRTVGVDLTRIEGISELTAQTIVTECGFDMSPFPNAKAFASWLGVCPNNRITGGRVRSRRTRRVKNRAADALRLAAQSLHHSKTAMGAYFRRMKARLGPAQAITATAHKLARIVYHVLKHGEEYIAQTLEHYERKFRERTIRHLCKTAAKLGLEVSDPQTGEILVAVS